MWPTKKKRTTTTNLPDTPLVPCGSPVGAIAGIRPGGLRWPRPSWSHAFASASSSPPTKTQLGGFQELVFFCRGSDDTWGPEGVSSVSENSQAPPRTKTQGLLFAVPAHDHSGAMPTAGMGSRAAPWFFDLVARQKGGAPLIKASSGLLSAMVRLSFCGFRCVRQGAHLVTRYRDQRCRP